MRHCSYMQIYSYSAAEPKTDISYLALWGQYRLNDWSDWNVAILSGDCGHQIQGQIECSEQTNVTTDTDRFQAVLSQLWALLLWSRAEFHVVGMRFNFFIASFSFSSPLRFGCCSGSLSNFIHACLGSSPARPCLAKSNGSEKSQSGSRWSGVVRRAKVSSPELIHTAG